MAHPWRTAGRPPSPLQRMVPIALVAALLVTGCTGHAGVQVMDRALAERIFALHLHGVPGEREYVEMYGRPAPFVPPHCHRALPDSRSQSGPDQVNAAASLAGAVACGAWTARPIVPPSTAVSLDGHAAIPLGVSLRPSVPPPEA
jgi:hypothetical protein